MSQEQDIKDLEEKKLSTNLFTWIMGTTITVIIILFGWLGNRVTNAEDKVNGVTITQATILERMENIQKTADRIDENVKTHIKENNK